MEDITSQELAKMIMQFQIDHQLTDQAMAKLLSDQLNDYINQQQVTA